MHVVALLVLLSACAPHVVLPCDTVCAELVGTCAYPAYPTRADCDQGCAYWEEQGVDVPAYTACVQDAACNTFQTVECEHEFGVSAQ